MVVAQAGAVVANYGVMKDALESIKQISVTTKTGKVKLTTIFVFGLKIPEYSI